MINWWGIAAWAIGTLGVGGTIAALIFAPAAAGAVLSSLWRGLLACAPCQLVLLLVLGLIVGDQLGFYRAARQCREAELRAALAAKQRDLNEANEAAQDAAMRAETIEANAKQKADEDEAYIDDLKRRKPADVCRLTDDDVRGLRESRDADRARTKPAAAAGVHGPRRRPASARQ